MVVFLVVCGACGLLHVYHDLCAAGILTWVPRRGGGGGGSQGDEELTRRRTLARRSKATAQESMPAEHGGSRGYSKRVILAS